MKKTPVSSARVIALSQKHMTSAPIKGIKDEELRHVRGGQIVVVRA